MLENWVNPAASNSFLKALTTSNDSCFFRIDDNSLNKQPSPIAIMGFSEHMKMIRNIFYALNLNSWVNISITDLGDIRNNEISLMTSAYKELLEQGIFPIIIDPTPNASTSLANAFAALKIANNQGIICSKTNIESSTFKLVSDIIENERVNRLSLIGYQKHFANPTDQNIPYLDRAGLLSLGKLRDDIKEAEPILRDLTSITFDLSSIKASNSMGLKNQSNIGLTSEEACKILNYAGSSQKLKSIHLTGFELDQNVEQAAELIASLLWYSLDGRNNAEDSPNSTNEMKKFIVELSEINTEIQFWKKQNSERWWVEIPNKNEGETLVPCSENEYRMACNNEISDRLFYILSNR